jgi:Xaa-Pro aminopeptidase
MPLNRERANRVMGREGVDAVVATSPENVYYVSDYWSLGRQMHCGSEAYALLPQKSDPTIIAPIGEVDLIVDIVTLGGAQFYGEINFEVAKSDEASEQSRRLIELYESAEPEVDGVSGLIRSIRAKGLDAGVIALDTSGITPATYKYLQKELPDANLVEGSSLLREVRLIKTEMEVELIRRATEITEKSMEDALEIARPKIMEIDLAGMFGYSVAYDGGRVTLNLIGFGERSAFPHPTPTDCEISRGELIRMVLGCTWRHYNANVSRTAVIGQPSSKVKNRWQAIMAAQDAVLDTVEPGVKISQIYAAAEKELKAAGIRHIFPSFGHGIGVECNEMPRIEKEGGGELMEGMVVNIDIPCLELGWAGVQIEDAVLITSDGFELLTRTDRTLYLL